MTDQQQSRAEQLSHEHWDDYICPLLKAHGVTEDIIQISAFHYLSAFRHGYKHAIEDMEAAS